MRLTRVHVDAVLTPGAIVELPRETASHLAKVLRARSGDPLILFSGDGREYAGSVESVRGSRVTASVGNGADVDRESPFAITLVQCVPRGDRMDFIVQKATELGVTRIVPVLSQRSVVRLDSAQAESKAAHWRAVVVNACEQCGRNRLPIVEAPTPLIDSDRKICPRAGRGGRRSALGARDGGANSRRSRRRLRRRRTRCLPDRGLPQASARTPHPAHRDRRNRRAHVAADPIRRHARPGVSFRTQS
jgi:hypothetical protein